jgi:hypothetical protein
VSGFDARLRLTNHHAIDEGHRTMKLSNHHRLLLAATSLALSASAFSAPSVRTITDVWGGTSNGNIAQGCTTFGPIPDLLAFFNGGGFRTLGGNTACGFTGVTSDQTATSGSLLVNQVLPPVALDNVGSSFSGAAGARASFSSLGVSAQGVLAGNTSGLTASVATGAAFFQDTLTATSPQVAPSAAGFVRYVFSMDGHLAAPAGQASVKLDIQQDGGPVYDLGRLGALTGDLGTFSAIDGSASTWTLDVDLPMVWGNPWNLTVGLLAQTNRSADASFMASAKLIDVQLFDSAHHRITDFTLSSASGTDYLNPPVGAVPEPSSWALMLVGAAALVVARRRAKR